MTGALTFDARGRITIPRELRKGLGKRVVAIKTPTGVALHPVPKHVRIPVDAAKVSGEDEARRELGL